MKNLRLILLLSAVSFIFGTTPAKGLSEPSESISVSSPNGGENYVTGQILNVKWFSSDESDDAKVVIWLYRYNDKHSDEFDFAEVFSISPEDTPDTGEFSYILPHTLVSGKYRVDVSGINSDGNQSLHDFSDGDFNIVKSPTTNIHARGSNVLGPDGIVYRITTTGYKRPYTSAGGFLSYKFNNWSAVQVASTDDMALPTSSFVPPRDGSLINDNGTVYLITSGGRVGFANESAFLGLGYSYQNVMMGDSSFLGTAYDPINSAEQKHKDGTIINQDGTIYLMQFGQRSGVPSMQVLASQGYALTEAVPANAYDRQAETGLIVREMTEWERGL